MSMNVVTLLYLAASVCFIQALKGLSHPTTSIRGNLFGMVGMAIAVVTTAALTETGLGKAMGLLAVALAAVNVFGGFLVTRRMLEMFKKKEPKAGSAEKK